MVPLTQEASAAYGREYTEGLNGCTEATCPNQQEATITTGFPAPTRGLAGQGSPCRPLHILGPA